MSGWPLPAAMVLTIATCVALTAPGAIPTDAAAGPAPVRLITLDPGHFHAALLQKFMYADVDPLVRVGRQPHEMSRPAPQ